MAHVPEGSLMQRAAAGLASVCAGLLRDSAGGVYAARVVVLTGTGDNGGDALYAAELLARRGASVVALRAGTRMHADGARALVSAGGRGIGVAPPPAPGAAPAHPRRPAGGPGAGPADARRAGPRAIRHAEL